ncbi:MAG: hypothetical protein J6B55_03700 [Clostridia bacterium]|nr:hypothetical protein [Clostridia bacterium]
MEITLIVIAALLYIMCSMWALELGMKVSLLKKQKEQSENSNNEPYPVYEDED